MPNHQNGEIHYYQQSVEQCIKSLKTDKKGISAGEVAQRATLYGLNKLVVANKEPLLFKLLRQFKDLMVVILIVAGSLSLYLGEYRDAVIMYTIVLVNAIISFIQEYKAEKVMESLKILVKAKAKVIRDGNVMELEQQELVPGDIVILEEGDSVPADLRIIEENSLSTNDFALTGESNPSRKFLHPIKGDVQIGDRHNLAFMGTTVATGNARGVVIGTGMQTEIGRIANLTSETGAELSPLQKELNDLAKNLTWITLIIGGILFGLGMILNLGMREAFLFALGVAASCVPEGLPAQVTIALSLASGRLAKKNAVIKKLSAVETLGSTHIICTDKTGTLTKNEMTVQKIFLGSTTLGTSGIGYNPEGNILNEKGTPLSAEELAKYRLLFDTGMFASNARISPPDKEHGGWYSVGDPTEAALINLARKAGLDPEKLDQEHPELLEFTFDSVRKRMSSIRKIDGKYMVYAKGSPQGVLERCTGIWDNGAVRAITPEDIAAIKAKDNEYATQALRNLGFAYGELENFKKDIKMEDAEKELVWLGLVAMIDPPREEVREAMAAALKAHIRVIIITGDYALTAEAIAKKVGLNSGSDKKMTLVDGKDLKKLSDIQFLNKLINSNLIFARTSPEDKLRIVSLLKKAGDVVAVTGDGVNDAPALKKADIGVAMGKTGTDVAKNSAGIILLDDSFATLVGAIKEGRTIFQNLKKTIISSLTSNGGELFCVLISLPCSFLLGYPIAITAVLILAIDLVGEMLPLTFLTWDPPQPRIMEEAPRNPTEHIMNKHSIFDLAWSGLLMGGIGYMNFLLLFTRENVSPLHIETTNPFYLRAVTLTYVSIVMVQWANIMSRRAGGQESVFTPYLWSNKRLLLGYAISFFFILMIVYNPFVSQFLGTAPLTLLDWVCAVMGGLIYLMIRETYKVYRKKKFALSAVKA